MKNSIDSSLLYLSVALKMNEKLYEKDKIPYSFYQRTMKEIVKKLSLLEKK